MNKLLNNEPVKRVQNAINLFNEDIQVQVLKDTAKTAIDAIEVKGSPYTKLEERAPLAISTNSSFSFFFQL